MFLTTHLRFVVAEAMLVATAVGLLGILAATHAMHAAIAAPLHLLTHLVTETASVLVIDYNPSHSVYVLGDLAWEANNSSKRPNIWSNFLSCASARSCRSRMLRACCFSSA